MACHYAVVGTVPVIVGASYEDPCRSSIHILDHVDEATGCARLHTTRERRGRSYVRFVALTQLTSFWHLVVRPSVGHR